MTSHMTRSTRIRIALPPASVMTLFTPEGERSWAGKDGWDPQYPVPSRTEGAGAVFTTDHGGRTTIWVMVDSSADRVRYARVTPGVLAGTVEVQTLAGAANGTDVGVTYELTALTDAGAVELARFEAGYDAEIGAWAADIADGLAGRIPPVTRPYAGRWSHDGHTGDARAAGGELR
jgi:hypothetical protein